MNNHLALASIFYPDPSPARWKAAAAAGFQDAEIDIIDDEADTETILAVLERSYEDLKAGGLAPTSLHLPFGADWDISAEAGDVRKNAQKELLRLLQWAGDHQIGIAILHPSSEPIPEECRAARLRYSTESIRLLGERSKKYGVTLAVEELPRTCLGNCADELLQLIDHGNSAKVCFDVNHLLKESHREFVEKVGPYIITTHLSDYDRLDEKHWMPGDGCIDWKELKQLLDGVGYQGRYLFELREDGSPKLGRPFTPKELADRFFELTR